MNNLTLLLSAIIMVESAGDNNAVGDNGKAVGCLQIWPCVVENCNRILGRQTFTLADRTNWVASIAMFRHYVGHYCTRKRLGREPTWQDMALTWHYGPRGPWIQDRHGYWAKVQSALVRHRTDPVREGGPK